MRSLGASNLEVLGGLVLCCIDSCGLSLLREACLVGPWGFQVCRVFAPPILVEISRSSALSEVGRSPLISSCYSLPVSARDYGTALVLYRGIVAGVWTFKRVHTCSL